MTNPPASEPQRRYVHSLLDERELAASPAFFDATNAMDAQELAEYMAGLHRYVDLRLTRSDASRWIDQLRDLPVRKGAPASAQPQAKITVDFKELPSDAGTKRVGFLNIPGAKHQVGAGRYALYTPGPEHANDVTFYRVWVGDRGGWSVSVQASDELHKLGRDAGTLVLAQIAEDPKAATLLYGWQLGCCGVCGRTLTNDASRAAGIGPICASRF